MDHIKRGASMVEDIIIRKMKPDDFEDVSSLNYELGYAYTGMKVKQRIEYVLANTKDIIFVAETKGEVVGYIHGSPYELLYQDSLINILGLVVKKKVRNLGIGHMLINELECFAINDGYAGLRLVSGMDRIDAHKFYERLGYTNRKNQKNYIKIFNQ